MIASCFFCVVKVVILSCINIFLRREELIPQIFITFDRMGNRMCGMGNYCFQPSVLLVFVVTELIKSKENTMKLCLNSRDELYMLDLDKVAYIEASGNYSRIVYVEGMQIVVTLGLSKVEELIKQSMVKTAISPFVRLGRSYIINQNYLTHINVVRQRLTLSDCMEHTHVLEIPKALLRSYKDLIKEKFTVK